MTNGDRVRVEVLGPLRATGPDGADLTPDGTLQRRLLALLVLHRGRVVSTDAAVDALWPDDAPRDPVAALQNQVSRLRRRLPDGLVESADAGYRLDAGRLVVDADELADAVHHASAGGDTEGLLDDLLARWRGPAFPELDEVDDGRAEAVRLDELRVRARELRAERRLAAGDADAAAVDLADLVAAEPLRERPRALLMEALAAAGRTVEALRAFDDFRRLLATELGIEPSAALAARHAELLAGTGTGAWRPPDRLPAPLTSLVGRDALAADVAAQTDAARLVVLVGPGGVGKTRLLVEVGHLLRAAEPDRPVAICELAGADAASAPNVVAAALGIDARPGMELHDQVAGVLGDASLVLLLDNCEHVLAPVAALVEQLLARCPGLTIVATSRERLRVPGEQVRPVPVLDVEGEHPAAVQLFLERARAVVPGYEPDEAAAEVIGEVVRRLDGLPLAIELAAARLHTHDLAEVAAGLDRRFALLSSGYRSSTRHGSLGAAVSWSFDMLDDRLQEVFSSLSAFAGSFTVDDAAAICDLPVATTADGLALLAERSLVMRAPNGRYVLLETLRAFGAEQLAARGRSDEVGARHARRLLAWAEEADRRLLVPDDQVVHEIDAALPELHLALAWMLDHGDVDMAGRLVVALLDYGILRLRPDVLGWAERVALADLAGSGTAAPLVWVAAAYAAWMSGDVAGCGDRAARALVAAEHAGGPLPSMVATINGSYRLFEGRLEEAIEWYDRAIAAAADDPAQHLFASATQVLVCGYAQHPTTDARIDALLAEAGDAATPHAAYAWYCAGETDVERDPDRARQRLATAIDLARRTGASFVTGIAGASKASLEARHGDPDVAAAEFRELIGHWRRAGMWATQWTMLRSIAALLSRRGAHHDAAVLVGAIRATDAGHRIFGADEVALAELDRRLCDELGEDACAAAKADGARLDGEAAVEHALRAL